MADHIPENARADQSDDCVSKRPWSEVVSRSAKLFMFNAAGEGGRSFGRILFYILLALIALVVVTFVIDSITGWFSDTFDFWPFNRAPVEEETSRGLFGFGSDAPKAEEAAEEAEKWYCRWNPLC
ncbi:hypothetical protein [Ovoidimarina sediminis]|uniref:hypothetical protein n=1 Tax=Ovoidimarina sediminis TaxID=3079856 RepID=UPI00290DED70|nr:hypothetical protein [Rhodophyticola sp. MJ-SS7]MDU8942965.1 hypothetical protein [Rhodophyticola sp. MJ-SS7]